MGIKASCKKNIFHQKKLKNHKYQCDNNTLHIEKQKKNEEELVKTRH
jgi:membrane-bound inhibitor of C-type lysozyme